jgi:hypothetical protein
LTIDNINELLEAKTVAEHVRVVGGADWLFDGDDMKLRGAPTFLSVI